MWLYSDDITICIENLQIKLLKLVRVEQLVGSGDNQPTTMFSLSVASHYF